LVGATCIIGGVIGDGIYYCKNKGNAIAARRSRAALGTRLPLAVVHDTEPSSNLLDCQQLKYKCAM
jgi:hypothetical protein